MKISKEITEDASNSKENELIRLFKEGHERAFAELVKLHQERVFKLAFGFFQDRDDAMEIVQETFLRIYEKIDSFDHEGSSFKSWVYRIAYNLCIDFYRKFNKRSKEKYNRDLYEQETALDTNQTDPEEHVDRENFSQHLRSCLNSLSKRQRLIFSMKHFNSLKFKEIAAALDISVGTAKSLHHRAAQSLKKQLAVYASPHRRGES